MGTRPDAGNWNVAPGVDWGRHGGSGGGGGSSSGGAKKKQGFWSRAVSDVANTFKGVPAGAYHLVTHDLPQAANPSSWRVGSNLSNNMLVGSVRQTGSHFEGLGYASHAYRTPGSRQAWSQAKTDYYQHPFSSFINDVTNVSAPFAAAGKGASVLARVLPEESAAARTLGTIGRGATKIGTVGGDIAGAPAWPYRAALRTAGMGGGVLENIAGRLPAGHEIAQSRLNTAAHPFQAALAPFHERQAMRATQRNFVEDALRHGASGRPLAGAPGPVSRTATAVTRALAPVDAHAFEALQLARQHPAETLATVAHMRPEDFHSRVAPFYQGTVPAQESFALAHRFVSGKLSPEMNARMVGSAGAMSHVAQGVEAQNLAGVGFPRFEHLSPEQAMTAGPGPMPRAVANDPRTQALLARVKPDIGEHIESGRAAADLANAPARVRGAVMLGQHLTGQGFEGVPTTAAELARRGFNPEHIRGGPEGLSVRQGRFAPQRAGSEALGRTTKPLAFKQTGEVPLTPEGWARAEGGFANRMAQNIANERIASESPAVVRPADLGLRAGGKEAIDAMRSHVSPETGRAGYSPWNPRTGGVMDEASVRANTPFLPDNVIKSLQRSPANPDVPTWQKAFNAVNRPFFAGNLALNPGWSIHRPLANAFMMTVGGGIGPIDAIRYLRQAGKNLNLQRSTIKDILSPAAADTAIRSAVGARAEKPFSPLHPIQSAYHLHDVTDRVFREATALYAKAKGMSDVEAADFSRKTMGDYRNLSPGEQNVKTAMPFYPWYRQTAQVAGRLARDNPMRLARTLQMSQYRTDAEKNAKGSLQGKLGIGGGYANIAKLNPLYATPDNPVLSPTGALGAMQPGARALYAIASGREMGGKYETVYRPRGEKGALSPRQAAYYLANQTAASRAALGAARAPHRYYPTGQDTGQPETGGRWAAVRRQLGTPWPEQYSAGGGGGSKSSGGVNWAKY